MSAERALLVSGMLLLSIAVLGGCGGGGSNSVVPDKQDKSEARSDSESSLHALIVSDNEDNHTVNLTVGTILIVRLQSNASTGFQWRLHRNDANFLRPIAKPQYIPPGRQLPGASGQQVFLFKAKKAGSSVLDLEYARLWEQGVEPVKTYHLAAEITEETKPK